MPRHYRKKARAVFNLLRDETHVVTILTPQTQAYVKKRLDGQTTHEFHVITHALKYYARRRQLIRRVYQTGEWWLFSDPCEQAQARSYFGITEVMKQIRSVK
jgi:hypothetical protein